MPDIDMPIATLTVSRESEREICITYPAVPDKVKKLFRTTVKIELLVQVGHMRTWYISPGDSLRITFP